MGIFGIGSSTPAGTPQPNPVSSNQPTIDSQRLQDMAAGAGLWYLSTQAYNKVGNTLYAIKIWIQRDDMGSEEQIKRIQEVRKNLTMQGCVIDLAFERKIPPTRLIQHMNRELSPTELYDNERAVMSDARKRADKILSKNL